MQFCHIKFKTKFVKCSHACRFARNNHVDDAVKQLNVNSITVCRSFIFNCLCWERIRIAHNATTKRKHKEADKLNHSKTICFIKSKYWNIWCVSYNLIVIPITQMFNSWKVNGVSRDRFSKIHAIFLHSELTFRQPAQTGILTDLFCRTIFNLYSLINYAYANSNHRHMVR